jgi:hypothetical protein
MKPPPGTDQTDGAAPAGIAPALLPDGWSSAAQAGAPPTDSSLPATPEEITEKLSLRTSLAEALSRMFAFEKSGGLKSVLVFALSLMAFSWFADSLLPLIQEAGQWLIGTWRGSIPAHQFADLLKKLALPAAFFAVVASVLIVNALRNARPRSYESGVPDPHAGLIVQLSDYNPRGPGGESLYATAADIGSAAQSGGLSLAEVFRSNWGQMAFAVRYHAPVLRCCWVICTTGGRGSGKDFASAEKLIKAITKAASGREAQCFRVELADENDIGQAAQQVSGIYRRLSEHAPEMRVSDLIADFTGGTAAMSGGMILATLDENQEIEYVRRGVTLTVDLDAAAVREQRVIVSPRISRGMVERFMVK